MEFISTLEATASLEVVATLNIVASLDTTGTVEVSVTLEVTITYKSIPLESSSNLEPIVVIPRRYGTEGSTLLGEFRSSNPLLELLSCGQSHHQN